MNALAATSMWLKCTFHLFLIFITLPKFNHDSGHHPNAGERDGKIREKMLTGKEK
jgi:hypothetical protein